MNVYAFEHTTSGNSITFSYMFYLAKNLQKASFIHVHSVPYSYVANYPTLGESGVSKSKTAAPAALGMGSGDLCWANVVGLNG